MGNAATNLPTTQSPLTTLAERVGVEANELEAVIKQTVMPAKDSSNRPMTVTNEQFLAFVAVANSYRLDPLKKEIYAFPAKGGGIQPIVSIDGWLSIINSHPQFDGMELEENYHDGKFVSVTCRMYRKDRTHPTVVTEDLSECKRATEPWNKPKRMLRHKATIQCARYAFGLGGIMEPDEAEAALEEREIAPQAAARAEPEPYPDTDFQHNLPAWRKLIEGGKKSPDEIIATVETKGLLTQEQKKAIRDCAPIEGEAEEVEE